jgi:hypothetical protein
MGMKREHFLYEDAVLSQEEMGKLAESGPNRVKHLPSMFLGKRAYQGGE